MQEEKKELNLNLSSESLKAHNGSSKATSIRSCESFQQGGLIGVVVGV